jgi:DNA-binding NarL/FixJ family response regulator
LKILIVEDSTVIVIRLRQLLGELEFISEMLHAGTAEEALMLVPQIHPDVIMLDINLPGKSGVDILSSLKKLSNATIIMLSNFSDTYYREVCWELGAEYFLDKSSEFEKINDVLKQLSNVA